MSNQKNDIGSRMKRYEAVSAEYLTRRMPVIIRLDGKAFHTFTRKFKRPFDDILMKSMWAACESLCADIQGCQLAYTQSDEISLLLTDYATLTTDAWYDYNVQKMVSNSAGMVTLAFNNAFADQVETLLKEKAATPEDYELDKKYYDAIKKSNVHCNI